jgi:hypothetical protein
MFVFYFPDNEELSAAIGRIAIFHGQMDHILRMTVKSILGLSVREAIDATRRQGSHELRERVRKLAKQKLGESEAIVKLASLLSPPMSAAIRLAPPQPPQWRGFLCPAPN